MCSYLLLLSEYKWDNNLLFNANKKIKNRGPDKTNFKSIKIDGLYLYYFHNLLDISGRSVLQPLYNDKKIFFLMVKYILQEKKI